MKIETDSEEGTTTIRVIGRLQVEHVAQLKKEIEDRSAKRVCLKEVTLVDADVVRFLTACEEAGILIVNCSAYIREWMGREREQED